MKKIFFALFLTVIFLFSFTKASSAQQTCQHPANTSDPTFGWNCYDCYFDWDVYNLNGSGGCVVNPEDITFDPDHYGCGPGFVVDDSICTSVPWNGDLEAYIDACESDSRKFNNCVESNPGGGFFCDSFDFKCKPCSGLTTENCSPPQYPSSTDCIGPCKGSTITRFNCDPVKGCVEAFGGTYEGALQCSAECGKPNLYCDNDGNPSVLPYDRLYTAIGCIPISGMTEFTSFVVRWSLALSGGISIIFTIIGGLMLMFSRGDKEGVKKARDIISSALMGLLLVIFSILIYEIVAVRILQIPGIQ